MEILIVDDDPFTLKLTSFVLEEAGYITRKAMEARTAIQALLEEEPDLVILDISMPHMSGFDLCREIRRNSDVPIIFVSARSQLQDKVTGLQIGGDDYIIKPYEPAELIARIGAVLRRRNSDMVAPLARLSQGGLTLDPVKQEVALADNRTSGLTPIEFRLLYYLMQNAGRVLSTDQILNKVWGYDDTSGRNLVAVYIRRLRAKIEASVRRPNYIVTVANLGYKFDA